MKGAYVSSYTKQFLSAEQIARITGEEMAGNVDTLNKANAPLDHDLVCEYCNEFTVPAGTNRPKLMLANHQKGCVKNPNRTLTVEEQMATWPERVQRGELIPFAEMSPYPKGREELAATVRTLAENGGAVVDEQQGHATAKMLELLPFDINGPNFTQKIVSRLEGGGWITRRINGKRTYEYALTKAAKVYYPPQQKQEEAPPAPPPIQEQIDEQYGIKSEPETATTETAGSSAEEPAPVAPAAPAPAGDDGEADELGGRPGRMAARILREVPTIVAETIREVMLEQRDQEYAAMGYYRTISQYDLDQLQDRLEGFDSREAQMQTRIDDLTEELRRLGVAFDLQTQTEDARLARSNDGTPAMRGSLTVAKVRDPYKGLARLAIAQGWTIKTTRGGHYAWRSPDGKTVFSASTTGDSNSLYIMRRKLRNAGLKIEGGTTELADVDRFNVGYTET